MRIAALLIASAIVSTSWCAAFADAEHPGPGEKIVRSTVGTAPQSLTDIERAKLSAAPARAPAAVSALRPAPWLPPGWREQLLHGGVTPTRASVARPAASHHATIGAAAPASPATRVVARPAKPAAVRTIGHGPRDASPEEIRSKRAAASAQGGGR